VASSGVEKVGVGGATGSASATCRGWWGWDEHDCELEEEDNYKQKEKNDYAVELCHARPVALSMFR